MTNEEKVGVEGQEQQAIASAEQQEETVAVPKGRFTDFMKSLFEGGKDEKAEDGKEAESKAKTVPAVDFEARLAEEKAKWEAEFVKKEELSKLPDADKAKAEADAQRAELAAVKQQLAERELKAESISYLQKEGYPIGLADMLNFSSKEAKDKTLEKVVGIFETALESAVKERLKGKTPIGLGGANSLVNQLQSEIAKNIRGGLN